MKQAYYWYGVVAVIVVILIISMTMNKKAGAPATEAISITTLSAASSSATSTSTTAKPVAKTASPSAQLITVHVKKGGLTTWYSSPTTTVSSEIHVNNPPMNTIVHSPLSVSGNAQGTWFFEASMPIFLTDAKGKILASSYVTAQSDWMTEGQVPFLGKLTFARQPTGSTGVFVIRNDNPSGNAATQKQVEILVTFN